MPPKGGRPDPVGFVPATRGGFWEFFQSKTEFEQAVRNDTVRLVKFVRVKFNAKIYPNRLNESSLTFFSIKCKIIFVRRNNDNNRITMKIVRRRFKLINRNSNYVLNQKFKNTQLTLGRNLKTFDVVYVYNINFGQPLYTPLMC